MESQLSRITAGTDGTWTRQTENLIPRSENENTTRSSDHVENGQQAVTQLSFQEILSNNNNVTPRQVGQILQAMGDELNNLFKYQVRSSKNG